MASIDGGSAGWGARLRRVATFVAIVWAVAGSFVLFEVLAVNGLDALRAVPGLDRITLSPAAEASMSCAVAPGEAEASPAVLPADQVRLAAWLLGLTTGRQAVLRNSATSNDAALATLEQQAREIAELAGVPPPDPFVAEHLATALGEFVAYVESADRATARRLAVIYTPAACEIFKLGAFWGYASLFRTVVPGEPALFAAEIRHHAGRIALPDDLSRALTARTAADRSGDEIAAESQAITDAVARHLQR